MDFLAFCMKNGFYLLATISVIISNVDQHLSSLPNIQLIILAIFEF